VSIGKRFANLVRANLNSIFDGDDEPKQRRRQPSVHIEDLSEAELEAELTRRRSRRDAASQAAGDGNIDDDAWREVEEAVNANRYRSTRRRRSTQQNTSHRRPHGSGSAQDARLARLYAQLECPYGSDFSTVRKHYRRLMRKYHPDMHAGDAKKQRLATDLSQRLTQAYNELRRHLEGR
jgi:DnaJ-domain-containing protein 1